MQEQQEIQIGDVFGKLVVVASAGFKENPNGTRRRAYRCMCSCGRETIVTGTLLKSGSVKSCGCWRRDRMKQLNYKHGGFGTRLYTCWVDMRRRCIPAQGKRSQNYADRGITVCRAWQKWERFRDWARNNGYAEHLTIDRIDNNRGYCPSNCRWVTPAQQNNNQRRTVRIDTPDGLMSLANAVRKYKVVCYSTAIARIRRGWSALAAVSTPRRSNKQKE